MAMPQKISILNLSQQELEQWMTDAGAQAYRGRQVFQWLYQKGATSFEQMTDLPAALREKLNGCFDIHLPQIIRRAEARDGTTKFLFELEDLNRIESVLIWEPEQRENTLCVSAQVGCKYGCGFCYTATIGFQRNLASGEILCQYLAVKCGTGKAVNIHRLVIMGMGEALDNFVEIKKAFEVFNSRHGMGLSSRRITISTAGVMPKIKEAWNLGANLAVSLNAADNDTRTKLMPINRKYPLSALVKVLRELDTKGRQKLTAEYVMLKGVNDFSEDADRLARLLSGVNLRINLIRFNPFPGCKFSPSDEEQVLIFQQRLKRAGFMTFIRKSKGREILAACGQLAGRER
jgi:23S rRNA (adenine2503-C2)-methyltransferase